MRKLIFFGLALLLSGSAMAYSQEPSKSTVMQSETPKSEVHHFQMKFRVLELEDGKVINTRSYNMEITTDNKTASSIRTSVRLPYSPDSAQAVNAVTNVIHTNFQYVEEYVKLDCLEASMRGNSLFVNINGDINTIGSEEKPNPYGPITQNRKISSNVLLPIGKPTIIFSSDDLSSKRVMQLEVTAVKLS